MTTDTTTTAAIEIMHLVKRFGNFTAVDDLSLRVEPGEIFGLLGPNGSGKTTTVNMVSGLSKPTNGEVHVMGYDLRTQTRQVRQVLGTVHQETALYEELSAWRNLDFHADLFGLPAAQKKARIEKMLDLVQLSDRKDSRVSTFSGGMKRRLALARALLHEPQLIYLDEPTLGVDVQSRRALWDYILDLQKQGKTVFITTNYLEEAEALCSRIAIIDHGRLVSLGRLEELKQKFGGSVVEIETGQPFTDLAGLRGMPGVQQVEQYGLLLKVTSQVGFQIVPQIINSAALCCEIRNITVREPNLDEVFLRLTGTDLRD
jgi:daunorubicin resistance ABC transporter ATP-binding subunit